MKIPPQAVYLYKGGWSSTSDTIFVDCLLDLKAETRWTQFVFPRRFHMTASEELKNNFGVVFTEVDLIARVDVLKARYYTFKTVLRQRGATWDMPSEIVIAPDEVWEKLFKINPFAEAYYHHEEPMYSKLACLFGMDDVKIEDAKEVIVISDKTEELPGCDLTDYDLGENDEEVKSPAVFPGPNVRRKLFATDMDAEDRESTTEMGIFFIDLAPDGQLRTKCEKGRALPKPPAVGLEQAGPSTRSPHASSCGSNSSIGWWPHLLK